MSRLWKQRRWLTLLLLPAALLAYTSGAHYSSFVLVLTGTSLEMCFWWRLLGRSLLGRS
jgi:hypothetical protein